MIGGAGHGIPTLNSAAAPATTSGAAPLPPQTIASLSGPDAHVSLPQSGLYSVDTNPDSRYLVETDPRFVDYANFISSDYLLDKLGYDPAAIGKRLGDGFYEERQVLDQITQLTGRRFLADDTDALTQYRSLMAHAVGAAQQFDLTVGVALTAEQVADLTQDIVWLVKTRVDGEEVLVPVVYLSQASARQLAQAGAVIAGRNVLLDASGDLHNNGSIVAGNDAALKADNLLNSGTLSAGGALGIQTAKDLLNQGGMIHGAEVSLIAGRDVVSSAAVGPVALGGVDLGKIATGSIRADHSLDLEAGRDLNLDHASLTAGTDLGLVAGRDLTTSAASVHAGQGLGVLAGRDVTLGASASHASSFDGRTFTFTTTQHVTELGAGGAMSVLAGRDLTSQGATLSAGDTLQLAAGRDLDLAAVSDHQHVASQSQQGHSSSTTVTDDDTLRGTTLQGANGVTLAAGRDAALTAAEVTSSHGAVNIAAGRDIDLGSASEHSASDTHWSQRHASGSTQTRDEHLRGTTLNGAQGVSLASQRDITLSAASVQSDHGAVTLAAGRDIDLAAASEHHSKVTDTYSHHSGFLSSSSTSTHDVTDDDTLRGTTLQGANGVNLAAGRDAALTAAEVTSSHGAANIAAGRDLDLAAASEHHSKVTDTYRHHSGILSSSSTSTHDATQDSVAVGSRVSGDSVNLLAGHDLATQGAYLSATDAVRVAAGHDVDLGAATDTHDEQHTRISKQRGGGWGNVFGYGNGDLMTRTRDQQSDSSSDATALGSTLSGDTVQVTAGHDLTTEGAQVAASGDLTMAAGHDLTIDAAANTHSEDHGLAITTTGGQHHGLHAMVGTTATQERAHEADTTYTGSLIGSTGGAVALSAGGDVHVTGSDVLSQTGTAIVGQNVVIDAALGHADGHQSSSFHKAGVMGGLSGGAVGAAEAAYTDAQRSGQASDHRLKVLYAAKAAYEARDAYGEAASGVGGAQSGGAKGAAQGSGTRIYIAIGANTANSHGDTHDDIAYGSHIRSAGDVGIAATNGDLDVVGSQITGDDVTLAATHDIHLASQAEQHTQKQSSANAGGQVGVSIGSTTGIYLHLEGGKGRAHGNGTTHLDSDVDASNTLSLTAGHDLDIQGAQAKGNTVLADIGHDLNIASEQDTGDYASNYWQAGITFVYGFGQSGVGVSGSLSLGQANNNYASVTQVSGIGAGQGGYDITVGHHTDLTGAVIASAADASKNNLSTGSLSYHDIQNHAKYSAWSLSVGGGTSGSMSPGVSGGIGIPQSGDHHSVTRAGIAQGTIHVRDGNADLAGLDRNPNLDAQGLANDFDPQKIAEQQQLGQAASYVGMRGVGDLASHEQNKAAADYSAALNRGDQAAAADAQARMQRWGDGGAYKVLLHGVVGAGAAALGGGDALQGALGATASELASEKMQQYLVAHGVPPDSATGKSLMDLASLAIGGAAGGGAGAATALQGEQYNRQLHPSEIAWLRTHGKAFAEYQCQCDDPSDAAVAAATAELTRQALRQVDQRWASVVGEQDDSVAKEWLAQNAQEQTPWPASEPFFTATEVEYENPYMYFGSLDRDSANRAFVQWAAGVGKGSLLAGGEGVGIGLKNGAVNLATSAWELMVNLPGEAKSTFNAAVDTVGLLDQGRVGVLKDRAGKALSDAFYAAGQGYVNAKLDSLYGGYSGDAAVLTFGAFQLLNPEQKLGALAKLSDAGKAAKLAELEADASKAGKLDEFKQLESQALEDANKSAVSGAANAGVDATLNADGTLSLSGDISELDAASDWDRVLTQDPVAPTKSGYVNQAKVCANGCVFTVSDTADQALAAQIAQQGDPTGALTESLVGSMAENQGWNVLEGGKYSGNKGFDAVIQSQDGSVTIVVDAKQLKNGAFKLGGLKEGSLQLSDKWINQVMDQLDKSSPAYQAVEEAMDTATLRTIVIGVDKRTGKVIGVPVNANR